MFAWHFSNNYIRSADSDVNIPLPLKDNANASWAINESYKTICSCQVDRKGKSDSLLGKSISVRNLFHYVGDIHQPLHAGGRVTKAMPDGDRGGNRFYIKHYNKRAFDNLHFLWDHQFDTGVEYWGPMTKEQSAYLTEWSVELMNEYENDDAINTQISTNWKFTDWENESS